MNFRAARTSALLCLLFLVVYEGCSWLTSLRHDLPSFYFQWERHIPFVPLMILPYMSIDLFFIASPFLCRDDDERRTLARRISAAIVLAGVGFLLFPLKFAFDRPPAPGWIGEMFAQFRALDRPVNQFPSLHIALQLILGNFYVRRARAWLKPVVAVWFVLIGLSTVLTYQHHVIDVVGGLALGLLCRYVFCGQKDRLPVRPNRRVGVYYAVAAIAFLLLATIHRPWTWMLLWPAGSFGAIAAAYFGVGPGIYRKQNGQLTWQTWLILWPVLLAQNASLLYYARRSRAWDELTPALFIGRKLDDKMAREAIAAGVTAVLDLCGEFSEAGPFRALSYRQLSVLDLTAPTDDQLADAVAFITEQTRNGVVYVHCKAGYSRTGAVAGAYLMASGQADSAEAAAASLRAARPGIILRREVLACLDRFHRRHTVVAE